MNPYLLRQRARYDELRASMDAIYTAAATAPAVTGAPAGTPAGRDLTEDEMRSVSAMNTEALALVPTIEALTAVETRNAAVADLAASVAGAPSPEGGAPAPVGDQHRTAEPVAGGAATGSAATQDRDPGHYRALEKGGSHSFFADQYRARMSGDEQAHGRLTEHARALGMVGEGVGTTTPKWLIDRFELILRQERRLANAVTQLPLGRDPRPMTLPKQITGTTTAVIDQSAENAAVANPDQYDTDVETITPATVVGAQLFSRQFLDSATPAIDNLIMNDLVANYNLQIEKRVGAAMVAAATEAGTAIASETAFAAGNGLLAINGVIDAAILVQAGRYAAADIIAMGANRWGAFRKLKDSSGRPLIPNATHQVMNVHGVGDVNFNGEIEGLGVIVTEGISIGTYPNVLVIAKASDTLLFEGDLMRFRYEEVSGPQSIKVGIWNYVAVSVRRPGVGQKKITVTAGT